MTVSAAAALIGGAWSVVLGGYGYYDLFGAVFSLLITPVVTYLFYAASERSMKASDMCEIGVFCMMSALAYAFHTVPSNKLVDLGAIFGYAAVMLVTAKFGIYRGIAAAVACGIAVSSESVPCYAAVTLMTAALSKFSLPLALCSSAASASAVGILLGGMSGFLAAFPPAFGKLLFGYLKGVAEEGVVLLKVVRFKISYIVFFHNQINSLSPSDRSSFFLVMTCQPFSPPRLYFSSTALATYSGFK